MVVTNIRAVQVINKCRDNNIFCKSNAIDGCQIIRSHSIFTKNEDLYAPESLVFDDLSYCYSLTHIGEPSIVSGLAYPILLRSIPETGLVDGVGPWPYASVPDPAQLHCALAALRSLKLVTATLLVRPDAGADWAALGAAGVRIVPLKPHYVLDPALPKPILRAKTRSNIAMARRHWVVETLPRAQLAAVGCSLQEGLAARGRLGSFANVPSQHFSILANLDGIEAVVAADSSGVGAVLVSARRGGETHCLHLITAPRAMRTCATHLLMATALERWGQEGRVYLGGAPDGVDGRGIAQFKARWANRTDPVVLLTAILDLPAYERLSTLKGATTYFPAYRGPTP